MLVVGLKIGGDDSLFRWSLELGNEVATRQRQRGIVAEVNEPAKEVALGFAG